jgi:hypothetical protein
VLDWKREPDVFVDADDVAVSFTLRGLFSWDLPLLVDKARVPLARGGWVSPMKTRNGEEWWIRCLL